MGAASFPLSEKSTNIEYKYREEEIEQDLWY